MEVTIESDKGYVEYMKTCSAAICESADNIIDSYESDREPFLLDEMICFPPRKTCDEYQLIQEVFFPKYFNCYVISLRENKALLKAKLAQLGWIVYCGIKPYYKTPCFDVVNTLLLK